MLAPRRTSLLVGAVVIAAGLAAMPGPASAATDPMAFTFLTAPATFANVNKAGEPSLGVNGLTGAMLYQARLRTYRLAVNPTTGAAAWADVTPTSVSSTYNLDPILAVDRTTGRTFAGGLQASCSALNTSIDDGVTWSPMANACSLQDHETVGVGAWRGAKPVTASSDRPVFYCASEPGSNGACAVSADDGTTFGPPVLIPAPCYGGQGHVKVSPNGVAFVPNNHCASVGGGISLDSGASWGTYAIPGATFPSPGFDPSIGTTPDSTVYQAWAQGNYHPYVARSVDNGTTWDRITDLSGTLNPPVVSSAFQAVTTGDNGRVAVAYLGSTTGGDPFTAGWPGVWDLYVSTSYDAGLTWSTVKASSDPVQRGYMCAGGIGCGGGRNLLDFMDANTSKEGRVVVGFADGCIGACALSTGTEAMSTSAYATVAYQSAGLPLFAAFDNAMPPAPSPTASPTPSATPSRTASPTPSPTATPTPSPTASPTVSPTVSPAASASASPTPSPTPSPTTSPSPSPTASATASPTASATASPTPSPTASPTPSATPSLTAGSAPSPTASPTPSPSPTHSPTPTLTENPTPSPTPAPEPNSTPTPQPTPAPSPAPAPTAPTLTGTSAATISAGEVLRVDASGRPGEHLELLGRPAPAAEFSVLRTATVPGSGTLSWPDLAPRTTTGFQVRSVDTGLTSRLATVSVRSTVSLAARRTSTRTWTFTGACRPTRPGQAVILYEVNRGGSLTRLGSAHTDGRGIYSVRVGFRTTGTRTLVTRTSADAINAAGQSAATSYRIT